MVDSLQLFKYFMNDIGKADETKLQKPEKFRDQVIVLEKLLETDPSGITNTLLDYAIECSLVDYSYITSNNNVSDFLNDWLSDLNYNLIGKIPVGLRAFAKQYFMQRWKRSSLLVTAIKWGNVGGKVTPLNVYMIEGRDIEIQDNNEMKVLGGESYYMLDKNGNNPTPILQKDVSLFVQKPFSSWSETYPTPFLWQRGVCYNTALLDSYIKKGSNAINQAQTLMLLRKGAAELAKTGNPNFIYTGNDLDKTKANLQKVLEEARQENKMPLYAANFDTEIDYKMPDFEKAVKDVIYSPVEKRILSGLGLIDAAGGNGNTRQESLLNPKPFIAMITEGIEDFKTLLRDIATVTIQKNGEQKYFKRASDVKVSSSFVPEFLNNDISTQIRGMYDRGVISKRTYSELVGMDAVDFDIEITRRKEESELKDLMNPPIIQNNGQNLDSSKDLEAEGKSGVDKVNYNVSNKEDAVYKKIEDLPTNLDGLPKSAKKIWMETFNTLLEDGEDEDFSRKLAWTNVKREYKKDDKTGKWKRKEKSSITVEGYSEAVEAKRLEVLEKQSKLLEKFNKES